MHRLIPALCLAGILIVSIVGCKGGNGPVAPVDMNKPAACFTAEPAVGAGPGDAVIFDAGCSTGGMFAIASYIWSWGDGSEPETTTEAMASHEFPSPGSWNVTLTVRNQIGKTDSSSEAVEINPAGQPPEACFTWDSPNGWQPGKTQYFDASCSSDQDGDALMFEWDWGDGTMSGPSALSTASHEFTMEGEFDVRLTVTDTAGWEVTSEPVSLNLGYPIGPQEIGAIELGLIGVDMAISGNYAYLATSSKMVVVDISSPSSPVEVGEFPATGLRKVDVDGNRVAICSDEGLYLLDVSNPGNPTEVAHLLQSFYIYYGDIALDGDFIYLAERYEDTTVLRIMKVQPDGTIEEVHQLVMVYLAFLELSIEGDILVVRHVTGIDLIDISDPLAPVLSTIEAEDPYRYYAAVASGDYLYATSRTTPHRAECLLSVFDITDFENPVLLQTIKINNISDIAIDGDNLLLGEYGLEYVDISNPSMPVLISGAASRGSIEAVGLTGEIAIVAGQAPTMSLIDFSSGTGPHYVVGFHYEEPGLTYPCRGVEVHGNYLFAGSIADSLRVFDISDPENPRQVTQIFFSERLESFCIHGDTLFTSLQYEALQLYDISDPRAPVPLGQATIDRLVNMVATDEYLYGRGDSFSPALTVVDIRDPHNIRELGSYTPVIQGESIALKDDIVYVTSPGWLIPVDVSNPNNPDAQPAVVTGYTPSDMEISGDFLYIPSSSISHSYRVDVYSLTEPAAPQMIASIPVYPGIESMRIIGDYAYAGAGDGGMRIYDVSDPYEFTPTGYSSIPLKCLMVDVAGNYAFAISIANYDSALSVVKLW